MALGWNKACKVLASEWLNADCICAARQVAVLPVCMERSRSHAGVIAAMYPFNRPRIAVLVAFGKDIARIKSANTDVEFVTD